MKFYQTGTADMFDLAEAWWLRDAVHRQMKQRKLLTPEQSDSSGSNLGRIVALAEGITDLRGQNAPNVTLVRSMSLLRQKDEWQSQSSRP